ncbi:hypothetical protein KM043_003786 [Ampulex compressa]|nr:hypothetical protein KM043_003786 [Ampulex compressa]
MLSRSRILPWLLPLVVLVYAVRANSIFQTNFVTNDLEEAMKKVHVKIRDTIENTFDLFSTLRGTTTAEPDPEISTDGHYRQIIDAPIRCPAGQTLPGVISVASKEARTGLISETRRTWCVGFERIKVCFE